MPLSKPRVRFNLITYSYRHYTDQLHYVTIKTFKKELYQILTERNLNGTHVLCNFNGSVTASFDVGSSALISWHTSERTKNPLQSGSREFFHVEPIYIYHDSELNHSICFRCLQAVRMRQQIQFT
jgi:hypothetical protein